MVKSPSIRLKSIKQLRRDNLARLLDEVGQLQVSQATGIAEAYLWQMAKGAGKSARGVSDDNAKKVEEGLKLESGWLDSDHINASSSADGLSPAQSIESHSVPLDVARLRSALSITERELIKAKVSMTPDAKADVVVAVYDLLVEGYSLQAAERTVTGMLRAFSGVAVTR